MDYRVLRIAIGVLTGFIALTAIGGGIALLVGARITVREAISTYGLSTGIGLMDRLVVKAKRISRLALLTIANTFRSKWQVVLIQFTLVLSGLIFVMVLTVRDSVVYTFGDILCDILNYNINFALEEPERIVHLPTLRTPLYERFFVHHFG